MKENKLTTGQTIFFETIDNRGKLREEIIETKIQTIGKKYFTVDHNILGRTKFDITTLCDSTNNGYGRNYTGYLSKEDITEKNEKLDGLKKIKNFFHNHGEIKISLQQVKSILEIIEVPA